jgi:hypothetical protein
MSVLPDVFGLLLPIMSTLLTVFASVTLVFGAVGLYHLQAWLERRDYDRHFND